MLAPVPHLGKAPLDWARRARATRDRILDYLEQRYIPDLRARPRDDAHLHAADFQRELNAHLGSAFSLEPVLTQSAWFRVHNRDDRIGGLYFVGAGTHPGAGMPGVVNSAKATAGLMLEDLGTHGAARCDDPLVERMPRRSSATARRASRVAARLFDPATRDARLDLLYAWCRHCDDVIDGQVLGHARTPALDGQGRAARRLERAARGTRTRRSTADERRRPRLRGASRGSSREHAHPAASTPHELLAGFAMDVEGRRYETLDDTLAYCYHVAGVVGLMMARVMGVRDEAALARAADLGIALPAHQHRPRRGRGRAATGACYLPAALAAPLRHRPGGAGRPPAPRGAGRLVGCLLGEAERYYASADLGIERLPFRSAWAVAVARGVYREIGNLVLARGRGAWDARCAVSPARKAFWLARGLGTAFAAVTRRPAPPASAAPGAVDARGLARRDGVLIDARDQADGRGTVAAGSGSRAYRKPKETAPSRVIVRWCTRCARTMRFR